jgi:hypothetical protein
MHGIQIREVSMRRVGVESGIMKKRGAAMGDKSIPVYHAKTN